MIAVRPRNDASVAEPAFLARVRLRARRQTLWLRALWAEASTETTQGLAISHDEVDRVLTGPAELGAARARFLAGDPVARELAGTIRIADEHTAAEPPLPTLRGTLGLGDAEIDLLTLAVAVEVDPALRRAFGYLHDDASACYPTPYLAAQLFDWPLGTRVGAESALVRWHLARPLDGATQPWAANTAWAADPYMTGFLLGGSGLDPALAGATLIPPAPQAFRDCLYPASRDAILAFIRALLPGGPVEIELVGPLGSGRRTLAAQCSAALGQPLLVIDGGALAGDAGDRVDRDGVMRAARAARLLGAVPYLHAADAVDPRLVRALADQVRLVLFGTTTPLAARAAPAARKSVTLTALTRAARLQLWSSLSTLPVPTAVASWALLPSDIAGAARAAAGGPEAIAEACRTSPRLPGQLVTPLPRPFGWDDIVLAPSVRRHLRELESQARERWSVYEDWGFERLCSLGRGIAALFAGPSGTGKTMAAQVLGHELGMEVFRVDLAGVMSKYIGETEKNLRQIFDACERANVLLFFDEADALFGQRMQVKDAHDRFANIEIDYLLQRMEQYDGLAVLATNRKGEIDTAFLRRIRFIVDFTPPGPSERLALWKQALRPTAPSGEPLLDAAIDFELLARSLDMTGADIKGAALGAAFLAHGDGARISMRHILWAARREMAKRGVVLRTPEEA